MVVKHIVRLVLIVVLLINCQQSIAQKGLRYNGIYSGVTWFDDRGEIISAHAANIIKDDGKYYLFGEKHSDTSNAFVGFNCYSSTDLYNWKFESLAFPIQDAGKLGPNRIGERVKVMKCPKTGEYVMFMHTDDLSYKDPSVGYATSKTIKGPYTFQGSLLFNGSPIKKWDMGTFQDSDGSGYLLIHGGDIFKLNDDYKSITEHVLKSKIPGGESPAVFKRKNIYYWLSSHRTSWERNDNEYYTSSSLYGPWTVRGNFAPLGSLTWNSQTTFVLPILAAKDTTYLFMGDRWSFPLQASAATYVWQPLAFKGDSIAVANYREGWQINMVSGAISTIRDKWHTIENTNKKLISYTGKWKYVTLSDTMSVSSSAIKDASFSFKFSGKQIGFYALSEPNGGYAKVTLSNGKGKVVLSSIVDMYCSYATTGLKFLSPILKKENYTLKVTVMGIRSNWSDKRKSDYGSKGNTVSLAHILLD